ncbi:MAG: hypothetical protein ACRD1D_09950, partial [Acidimicrobiales bacterium]
MRPAVEERPDQHGDGQPGGEAGDQEGGAHRLGVAGAQSDHAHRRTARRRRPEGPGPRPGQLDEVLYLRLLDEGDARRGAGRPHGPGPQVAVDAAGRPVDQDAANGVEDLAGGEQSGQEGQRPLHRADARCGGDAADQPAG